MKKIWKWLALFFMGVSAGIAFGVKYLGDKTIYRGRVLFKQRGRGNKMSPTLTLTVKNKKEDRRAKRVDKKAMRIAKRLAKKK